MRAAATRLYHLPPPTAAGAALAIVMIHGVYSLKTGVILAPDSERYGYWAGRLVSEGFDYASVLAQADPPFPAVLYMLFATLVAILQLLFGSSWPAALVFVNFVAHVLTGVMICHVALRLSNCGAAAWAALILFLGCFDLLQWVDFALSDATFVLLAFTTFTLAANRLRNNGTNWLPVAILAAIAIFYRPTGIVLVPELMLAFGLSRRPPGGRRSPAILVGTLALLGSGATIFAWLMQDPSRWPLQLLSGAFRYVSKGYQAGEVVSARPDTYHSPPHQLADYLAISVDRFLHFFAVGGSGYSSAHWLASAAFLIPAYLLGAWLLIALWRRDTPFELPARKVFITALGAVLAYASFHALVQVDFDWRYRTPILPHLILLAAGGCADLLRRASRQ